MKFNWVGNQNTGPISAKSSIAVSLVKISSGIMNSGITEVTSAASPIQGIIIAVTNKIPKIPVNISTSFAIYFITCLTAMITAIMHITKVIMNVPIPMNDILKPKNASAINTNIVPINAN